MAYRNPKTNRPIKFGTRVYNKLLQEGYTEEQLRENQPAHLQINNDIINGNNDVVINVNNYIDYLPVKTVINIKNVGEKSFMYSILCSYVKLVLKIDSKTVHFERVSSYKDYLTSFDFNNINFPSNETDYIIFENQNHNYCLYVYGYNIDTGLYSIYTSNNKREFNECDQTNALPILLINDSNYLPIININPFIRRARNGGHKYLFCYHCLNSYTSEKLFINHLKNYPNEEYYRSVNEKCYNPETNKIIDKNTTTYKNLLAKDIQKKILK